MELDERFSTLLAANHTIGRCCDGRSTNQCSGRQARLSGGLGRDCPFRYQVGFVPVAWRWAAGCGSNDTERRFYNPPPGLESFWTARYVVAPLWFGELNFEVGHGQYVQLHAEDAVL
jgi:hypothetical protein